jgi:hypothetical protein
MKLAVVKTGPRMISPADPEAEEWMNSLSVGELFFVRPQRPRNPKHHRLAFAMFQFVLDATDRFANVEQLLLWLKLQTGHYQEHITENGEMVFVPKSISFASMPEDQFTDWHAKALEAIRRELLPTMSDADMAAALEFYEGARW